MVTSYELQVISYELPFLAQVKRFSYLLLHVLRVTFYILVKSHHLLHELQVNSYLRVTSYYLLPELQVQFIIEIRSIIYCTIWDCNVDYVKFLHYTGYSFLWSALYKIKYS